MFEFNEWKLQEERKSKAHFVQNSSAKIYGSLDICTITVIEVGITNQKAKERDQFKVKEHVEVLTLVLHISKNGRQVI